MARSAFTYALMLYRENGDPLGQAPVAVDWEPAEEWTRFHAVRRGKLEPAEMCETSVLPLWHARAGEPFLRGFRVELSLPVGAGMSHDFSTAYFKDLAVRASNGLVERGLLQEGEVFRYRPLAFPGGADSPRPRAAFVTEEVIPPIPLGSSTLTALGSGAVPSGEHRDGDVPVFVPCRVLEETADLTRGAEDKETGGILIGHLHRDPSLPEVAVEITAQIPARHARAESTRLAFTPETWTALQAALDLRRRDEVMLGWWHSHPSRAWCGKCPAEKQTACALAADFFSEHDRQLHRTVFPRAYSVALVVNDAVAGLSHSMFGWREGLVAPRGFNVIGEPRASAA